MASDVHQVRSFEHPGQGRKRAKATPKGRQVDPTAAHEIELSFAEVFETATFYAHFDIVKEGEPDIAPLTIRVCDSLTCAMFGAEKLLQELQHKGGPGIRVVRAPCVGRCDTAPAVEVGHNFVDHATVSNVLAAAKAGNTHAHLPKYIDYAAYVA